MARNGSGTYSVPDTFESATTITASSHNANWTDIGAEITNSIAVDGQSVMTGQLKAANGTNGAPSVTFGSDLDTGFYRIGANNIGLSLGGTKYGDWSSTALNVLSDFEVATSKFTVAAASGNTAVAGTLGATGNFSVNSTKFTVTAASGNTAVAGDLAVTGNVSFGTLTLSGAAMQYGDAINATLQASVGSSALTISLKTLAGADASSSDPILVAFRNATVATGNYVYRSITAASSLVISSGSKVGAADGIAFKLWIVLFDDGGTLRLGAINCRSGVNIYPLGQVPLASSTTEGGGGAADSAQVFYTGTGVTTKPYIVLGYMSWETGLSTAGTWDATPTRIQLYGHGVPLPGQEIQSQESRDAAVNTGSVSVPNDNTIPQNTEGDQYMSQAITPTSAANLLRINHSGIYANSAAFQISVALFQGAAADAIAVVSTNTSGAALEGTIPLYFSQIAGTTGSTTFTIRAGAQTSGTTTFNGSAGNQRFNGTAASYLSIKEIMA